jgi:hypothetical protein
MRIIAEMKIFVNNFFSNDDFPQCYNLFFIFILVNKKIKSPKVLFICKQRPANYGASYGLLNSCRFLVNALERMGVEAKLVEVIDNNGIDKEVHQYKPTHVFIEALWVVPEKFDVLIPLHPTVKWYVRLHSNTPFIANEGVAVEWIKKYAELQKKYPQFVIAPNSLKMANDLKQSLGIPTTYAPNIYVPHKGDAGYDHVTPVDKHPEVLDIGCFGAIRPLKNQLIQAMAAMAFANELGKTLRFHINHTRVETHGENAHKNLVALFAGTKHQLITHDWMLHENFMHLIRKMDYGLQVSFSETFNIVAADFVHMKVPIVGSKEIDWMSSLYQADCTDIDDILNHLWLARLGKKVGLHSLNNLGLNRYNALATEAWVDLLNL